MEHFLARVGINRCSVTVGFLDFVVATQVLVVDENIGDGPLSRLRQQGLLQHETVVVWQLIQFNNLDGHHMRQILLLKQGLGGPTIGAIRLGINDDGRHRVVFLQEFRGGGAVHCHDRVVPHVSLGSSKKSIRHDNISVTLVETVPIFRRLSTDIVVVVAAQAAKNREREQKQEAAPERQSSQHRTPAAAHTQKKDIRLCCRLAVVSLVYSSSLIKYH
eukprot:scaffold7405_cov204-Amphora_coffeaeformis.AAC.17